MTPPLSTYSRVSRATRVVNRLLLRIPEHLDGTDLVVPEPSVCPVGNTKRPSDYVLSGGPVTERGKNSLAHRHDGTVGVAVVTPRDFVVGVGVRAAGDAVEAGRGIARGRRERARRVLAGVVHDGELPGRGVLLHVGD